MLIVAAVRDCLLALIAGKVILGARRDGFIIVRPSLILLGIPVLFSLSRPHYSTMVLEIV